MKLEPPPVANITFHFMTSGHIVQLPVTTFILAVSEYHGVPLEMLDFSNFFADNTFHKFWNDEFHLVDAYLPNFNLQTDYAAMCLSSYSEYYNSVDLDFQGSRYKWYNGTKRSILNEAYIRSNWIRYHNRYLRYTGTGAGYSMFTEIFVMQNDFSYRSARVELGWRSLSGSLFEHLVDIYIHYTNLDSRDFPLFRPRQIYNVHGFVPRPIYGPDGPEDTNQYYSYIM